MAFNADRVGSTTRTGSESIFATNWVFVSAVPPHVRTVWFQIPTARLKLHVALNLYFPLKIFHGMASFLHI